MTIDDITNTLYSPEELERGMPSFEESLRIGDEQEAKEKREAKAAEDKANNLSIDYKEEDENKRVLNYLYLPTWLWKWCVDTANAQGMKMERFVVYLLERASREWTEPGEESSAEDYNSWGRHKILSIAGAYKDAIAIAVNYKEHPTEEGGKLVIKACEKIGVDPDEFVKSIRDDNFTKLAAQHRADPDTKMSRCIQWVIKYCQERGDREISSEEMNKDGDEFGFSKQMISSARRKVGIESVMRGGKYYLTMPKAARVLMGGGND